jgi:hypothetical protein
MPISSAAAASSGRGAGRRAGHDRSAGVEVCGRKKRGVAWNHQGQRAARPRRAHRLLDSIADHDWHEAIDMDGAQVAVADYGPDWWPAATRLLSCATTSPPRGGGQPAWHHSPATKPTRLVNCRRRRARRRSGVAAPPLRSGRFTGFRW